MLSEKLKGEGGGMVKNGKIQGQERGDIGRRRRGRKKVRAKTRGVGVKSGCLVYVGNLMRRRRGMYGENEGWLVGGMVREGQKEGGQ